MEEESVKEIKCDFTLPPAGIGSNYFCTVVSHFPYFCKFYEFQNECPH